jgi:hypothetical protein
MNKRALTFTAENIDLVKRLCSTKIVKMCIDKAHRNQEQRYCWPGKQQ